ncbi:MAG: BLUF domain-containing protein [Pseudomonadota bacterium]
MYRLAYVSLARENLKDDDIAHILDVSVNNNYERFITGFLVQAHGRFMQVLEGEEAEVRLTYEKILEDHRHTGVTQIIGESIKERAFPDWSMNYHRVDGPAGSATMVVRRDEPVDSLMPATTPRDLLYLFGKFITMR